MRKSRLIKLVKRFKWISLTASILIIIITVTAGCSSGAATSANTPSSTVTTSNPDAAASALSGNISEAGSTTVQPLAEKLAGAFKTVNPNVKVDIKGGGSSVGIKAANDGTVDIGAVSRELTQDDPQLQKFLLAKDGIAIIVSPANTVNDLSKNQIRDIFAGVITNWSQVGGPDKEIHVVAREEGSGTRTAFQEMVMGKDAQGKTINLVKNTILQSSNGALLQVVKGDAQAIGFISFGYLNSSVKALSIDGIAATEANAKSGDYPIVRPLYFVTRGQPTGVVKSFIEYCTGPEAQKLVAAEGYISVN